ncbi:MAG: AAA family ATPase, partial [Patescibacteria group bacterium]
MRSPERQFNALTPDQEKQSEAPKAPEASVGKIPIAETETAVSYLGVTLEKAKISDSPFVPKREKYADYINDKDFALPFQRDLATAFLNGDPYLGEGGTSLGKTTTAKKMAAELGWEVHYANFNGATDVEDFMGRYIPNPFKIDRTKITDEQYQKIVKQWRAHTAEMDSTALEAKEYIFADGKVTSGLRQEEGKIKVIILDEINAASPNILIRLHEVLDVLERGGDLVLSEDASEAVAVDKNKTKIVAFMNPPGKKYIGLGSLSPAQLRRWVYQKLPSELPDEAFKYATKSLFFGEKEKLSQKIDPEIFLQSREQVLTEEQLEEIPGIHEVEEKFEEFHKAAKELLKNRKIAEDQPQPLTYDDRMEPRRVRDFVLRFYNGDVSETFQRALQYYYANKLESDADREKLGELIRLVEYKPKAAESKRKGPERKTKEEPKKKPETGPETRLEGAVAERKEAEEMGLGEKTETDPEFLERFEKKSLNYIERLLSQGADQAYVAQGLAGLDSDRAWAIREKLLSEDADKNHVARGLAGLDSDRAWTMREKLLSQDANKSSVAAGLAGLDSDRAWAIREKLL